METFDKEVLDVTLDWLDRVGNGDKPWFCWFNTTAIHIFSHPQKKYVQKAVDEGRAEEDVVRAKMLEHDEHVGKLLKKLKELGYDYDIVNAGVSGDTSAGGLRRLDWSLEPLAN